MNNLNHKKIDTDTQEKILTQVSTICSTTPFMRSEKLSSFLKFIIDEYLHGKSDLLKAYTIAVEVFNRPGNFDAQTDSIVRVYGGKLRRELKNYYENNGESDKIIIKVPTGSYIPIVQHRDEIKNRKVESAKNKTKSKVKYTDNPAIAVVIFDCLNEKDRFSYITNGLSEEIVIAMGRFKEVKIIGPLRKDYLREKGFDIKAIGEEYNVRFVLDGTLRVQENILRLTVRLNDALNAQQLWGKIMECDTNNGSLSEFENTVISNTVSNVTDNYGIISRSLRKEMDVRPSDNPTTYEAILRYYHHFIVLTGDSQIDAINALEKAIKKEPKNALALAMLGDLVASTHQFGYSDSISMLDRAEELGRKAISIDPNCQTARFLMGLVYFLRYQRDQSMAEFNHALELNPNNAHYIAAISLHLAMMGEWDRGVELMDKACRMNPHYPGWHHLVYFMNYYRQGNYKNALDEANRFNTPEYYMDPFIRAAVLGKLNQKKEAKKAVTELLNLVPDFKERGPGMFKRFAYSDENVNILMDGLLKAGL